MKSSNPAVCVKLVIFCTIATLSLEVGKQVHPQLGNSMLNLLYHNMMDKELNIMRVCCVGIAVADVVVQTISELPGKGRLGLVDNISIHTGGCAINAAIDLARLGCEVSLCSLVGDDAFGDFLKTKVIQEGIDTNGLLSTECCSTSSSVVLSHDDGERSFIHNIGANGIFSIKDINWDVINKSDIIFVAGALLMPVFDGVETALFLKEVKTMGKTTILDTAWDSTGQWMDLLEDCLPYVDYFIPSIEEAEMISGKRDLTDIVDVFKSAGAKNIIIKLGENGCYANINSEVYNLGVYEDVEVVDTNGAGDSFVSGFITALIEGDSPEEILQFATAVGAHCVGAVGASTGVVHKSQIYRYMKKRTCRRFMYESV